MRWGKTNCMNPVTVKNNVTLQVIMFVFSCAEYIWASVYSRTSVHVCTCSGVEVYTCTACTVCACAGIGVCNGASVIVCTCSDEGESICFSVTVDICTGIGVHTFADFSVRTCTASKHPCESCCSSQYKSTGAILIASSRLITIEVVHDNCLQVHDNCLQTRDAKIWALETSPAASWIKTCPTMPFAPLWMIMSPAFRVAKSCRRRRAAARQLQSRQTQRQACLASGQ